MSYVCWHGLLVTVEYIITYTDQNSGDLIIALFMSSIKVVLSKHALLIACLEEPISRTATIHNTQSAYVLIFSSSRFNFANAQLFNFVLNKCKCYVNQKNSKHLFLRAIHFSPQRKINFLFSH